MDRLHAGVIVAGLGAALAALSTASLAPAQRAPVRDLIAECAYCHGDAGIAKGADVPHLAGQQRLYLYQQMAAFRDGKRRHKEMQVMGRQMTEADMRAIADYYSRLPPR
jgi:cytochrome c553